ncbi:MAG: NAD(P)-dependent oxidoreductase [Clostridiaceae bacterium]|nr:NAD(P)-dependent oxidoreductase [Clostridiaceae bacterium]
MDTILVSGIIPPESISALQTHFHVITPIDQAFSYETVMKHIGSCQGLLAYGLHVDEPLLALAENLRIISTFGVGYDHIDVAAAEKRHILVTNTPHAVTDSTADLAMALILDVMRRVTAYDKIARQIGNLDARRAIALGHALRGKKLGLLGMGRIGKAVAGRAASFGLDVIYYQRHPLPPAEEEQRHVSYRPLDSLLKEADILSLHVPLNQGTYHLIGERELALMKPSACLINTARGAVADQTAMIAALRQGRLAGAGLDVFAEEPELPAGLFDLDQVVITPHIGTATPEDIAQIADEASRNLIDWLCYQRAPNRVTA